MFYVRPSDFITVSFKDRHVMGGIIMTSIEYVGRFLTITGIVFRPSQTGVGYFNHSTKELTLFI